MKRRLFLATAGVLIAVSAVTLSVILPRIRERTFPDRMMNRAIALAHEIPDVQPRISTLVGIASQARKQGDIERARELLQEAQKSLSERKKNTYPPFEKTSLVVAMMDVGMFRDALKVAKDMKEKTHTLSLIAPRLVRAGHLDELVDLTQTVQGEPYALSSVAESLIHEGLLNEALQFAHEVGNTGVADMMRWRIGLSLLLQGKPEEALKVARDIKEDGLRARVVAAVAQVYAQRGQDTGADRLFREAVTLATAFYRLGEKGEDPPGWSLNEVVLAMASAGKYREALDVIAREGLDRMFSYTPRAQVAIRMAEHGRFQDALKLARSIPFLPHGYPSSRFFALEHIGKAMANAGRYEEAAQVAREMGKSGSSVWMAIGEAKIKTGQYEQAFALSREMDVDGASLQIAVCEAAAKEGRYEKAIQLCARMAEPHGSEATLAVVRQMCERGGLIDAQPLARTIRDAEARDTAFATLASHLARAGNFVEAKRALKEIRDAEVRCQTQLAIANALAKAGRLSDAERMFAAAVRSAKDLKESNRRSYTLSEVATAMAEVASREPFTSLP